MRETCFRRFLLRDLGRALLLSLLSLPAILGGDPAWAVITMGNDPRGFEHLAWGVPLTDRPELTVTHDTTHITDYEFHDRAASYADIPVESLQLSSVDRQFARVTVRYRGEPIHKQMLQFLERTYGKIERMPGQMLRGLNQQYTWRGPDTDITLTYEASRSVGFIFIESRTLAPRFQDRMSDTAE